MKPENAKELCVASDLSECTLEEAILQIGPSFLYELTVSLCGLIRARNILRHINAQTKDNPFSPYINIKINLTYKWDEWCIKNDIHCIWSPGA